MKAKQINPNSALYWMGAAEAIAEEYEDLNVPETEIVEFDFMDALPLLDGQTPDNFPYGELDSAACDLGWPVFIRTDLTSAKHDGLEGVQAKDAADVDEVAARLVSDCAMKSMRPAAFLVREWIDIDHEFRAFGELPIGVEFRVFATPDEHFARTTTGPRKASRTLRSTKPSGPTFGTRWSTHESRCGWVLPPEELPSRRTSSTGSTTTIEPGASTSHAMRTETGGSSTWRSRRTAGNQTTATSTNSEGSEMEVEHQHEVGDVLTKIDTSKWEVTNRMIDVDTDETLYRLREVDGDITEILTDSQIDRSFGGGS